MQQIKSHPWVNPNQQLILNPSLKFLNDDLKLHKPDRHKKQPDTTLDEEIYQKCQELFKDSTEEFMNRENILDKKRNDFVISYQLLLDQKLSSQKDKVEEPKLVPLFLNNSVGSSGGELSTRASTRSETLDLITVCESPNNWVYGIRTSIDPKSFSINLYNSLRDAELEWKIISTFILDLKYHKGNRVLKIHLAIYKYDCSFVLDFKLTKGDTMIFLEVLHRVYYLLYLRSSC